MQTALPVEVEPNISDFKSPNDYVAARIQFLKRQVDGFSVLQACRGLRKVSPTLITLICGNKRRISLDRVSELAKLLRLTFSEKNYFRQWIESIELGQAFLSTSPSVAGPRIKSQKSVGTHLLKDWLNVYVKDCFQLPRIQKNPGLIYEALAGIATPKRIEKSMQFLLREGYLRRKLSGEFCVETNLAITDNVPPNKSIRQFHRAALKIAMGAIEIYSAHERYANTLTLPLSPDTYPELIDIIKNFAEQIKDFAESKAESGERLYQITLNLSPTGGKSWNQN